MRLGAIPLAMLDRPGQAMREAASHPRGWWLPALLLVIGLATHTLVSVDAQVSLANERTTQIMERMTADMSEEQAQMVRQQARPLSRSTYILSALGGGVVTMAIGWLARGALAHLGGLVLGGVSAWGSTFASALWSMVPFFVRDMLMTVLFVVRGQFIEQMGLSFLVSSGDWLRDSHSVMVALLSNVDPFTVWHLVLLALAVSASTRLGRGRGAVLAIAIWAILTGLKLIPVAITAALTGQMMG